ncbi:MAG: fructose-bisphosphatase class II [Candidatus Zixiibacteriota bacterium]
MNKDLRYDIVEKRLAYTGKKEDFPFFPERMIEFNHRHRAVMRNYNIELSACNLVTLSDKLNFQSNLGALRNRQLRQSVILASALSAIAVGLHGRGSFNSLPKDKQTHDMGNYLKRANDRTAAQIMAEVLQTTTETFPVGEEVLIESAITEGVRVKPGKEAGGNPTIAVGAVYGKKEHRATYGLTMPQTVSLLSMGNDVIEGTTKSIMGLHSSLTTLFVTEGHIKRHLPDVYVQRWLSGAWFKEFNPREASLVEAAEIISESYGLSKVDELSAFFLDRPRHRPAMDNLNRAGVATPFDQDGDLIPATLLGLDGLSFPDQRGLSSMIGEIGGSAEWAVGVLPLVWRGGQAIGMLTSQSSLTRADLSPEAMWKERFHFTEDEFMQIQDARFEQKPYFTISDIIDNPHAGGISAFGAITDNYFMPIMKGVSADREKRTMRVDVLTVNSLGMVQCWMMEFRCKESIDHTIGLMISPKEQLEPLKGKELEQGIGRLLADERARERYRMFFCNEYYPALIPVRDRMVLLHRAIDGLIDRGALTDHDSEIVRITRRLAADWFINSD